MTAASPFLCPRLRRNPEPRYDKRRLLPAIQDWKIPNKK